MICLCRNCVKSRKIQKLIDASKHTSSKEGPCLICGTTCTDLEKETEISYAISQEIRFHYPAYKYITGTYTGIESAFFPLCITASLFAEANDIFQHKVSKEKSDILMDWIYKTTDLNDYTVFDIFAGDKKMTQCIPHASHYGNPLKEASSVLVDSLKCDIERLNYYEIEEKYSDVLEDIIKYFPQECLKEQVFYRARKGHNEENICIDDTEKEIKIPYIAREMQAPPPNIASAGRFNRMGCSFLYLAQNESTAIAELKPNVGVICSTAKFKCLDQRPYLDFRKESIPELDKAECDVIVLNVIRSIVQLFEKPVDHVNEYLITEFLADIFRKLGFGGIIYQSVQTTGYNVLSFYPSEFEIQPDSEKMTEVVSVQYQLKEVEDGRNKYDRFYYVDDPDNEKEEKYRKHTKE